MQKPDNKRPRQYAKEIIALPSHAERANALEQVPAHLKSLTRQHLVCSVQAIKRRRKMQAQQLQG